MKTLRHLVTAAILTCAALFALYAVATTRLVSASSFAADSQTILWANSLWGFPKVGTPAGDLGRFQVPGNWPTLVRSGTTVPGVTTATGFATSAPFTVPAPWPSVKLGVANTIGAAPLTHASAATCLANMSPPLNWFINYAVTPWGYSLDPATGGLTYHVAMPLGRAGPSSNISGQPQHSDPPDSPCNSPSCLPIPSGVQFVPMFIDCEHVETNELTWAAPYVALARAVVAFNEPYGEGTTTAATAASSGCWGPIQTLAQSNGARIVAPSIGFGSGTAQTWLSDWLTALTTNGFSTDSNFLVLNFHETIGCFGDACSISSAVQAFFSHLDAMHATYPTYNIWVTEWQFFATDAARITTVNDTIVTGLSGRPWVERFALWPMGSDPVGAGGAEFDALSLCDVNGSVTSPTGANYLSYTHRLP